MSNHYSGEGGLNDIRERLRVQESIVKTGVSEGLLDDAIDAALADMPDFVVIFDNSLA